MRICYELAAEALLFDRQEEVKAYVYRENELSNYHRGGARAAEDIVVMQHDIRVYCGFSYLTQELDKAKDLIHRMRWVKDQLGQPRVLVLVLEIDETLPSCLHLLLLVVCNNASCY